MVKKNKQKNAGLHSSLSFIAWLTGVIVALSVAFGMIEGVLSLPRWLGGSTIAVIAGWIVVVTTILGVILGIVNHMQN